MTTTRTISGLRALVACASGVLCAVTAARAAITVVEPPSIILPNYGLVIPTAQGALEAGALLCRAKASEAGWYNPAGLVRCKHTTFSANASLYQLNTTDFSAGDTTATSSSMATLPAFVGNATWIGEGRDEQGNGRLGWGYSIVTPVDWESDVSSFNSLTLGGGTREVTSNSSAQFETMGVGVTLSYANLPSYAPDRRFTTGLSAYLYNTTLRIQRSVLDDWTGGGDTVASSSEVLQTLDASYLGLTLGAYYMPRPGIEMGFVARLPGISLGSSGSYYEHSLTVASNPAGDPPELGTTDQFEEITADDSGIETEWNLPLELSVGVSWRKNDGEPNEQQFEIDLIYHQGGGTYKAFPAGTTDILRGTLASPTPDTDTYAALTTTSLPVLDLAFGYRWEINRKKRLHAGFRTSFSPVKANAEETLFQSVDMLLLTVGMSTQTERTFTSFGLVLGFGGIDEYTLNDIDGGPVTGDLSVRTIALVMGASFKL